MGKEKHLRTVGGAASRHSYCGKQRGVSSQNTSARITIQLTQQPASWYLSISLFLCFNNMSKCLHFEPILSKTCLFLFLFQVMRNRPLLPELLLEDGIMADIHGGAENTQCDRKPGSGLCIRRTELSMRRDYNSLPPKGAPK